MADAVNSPKHYNSNPSGVECITVVEHMNFNRGNAMKYVWRAGDKGDEIGGFGESALVYRPRDSTPNQREGRHMKCPRFILARLRDMAGATALKRDPDFLIGGAEDPYMRRWWIIPRNKFFNIYLHHFLHSDDDRALHDHPWWNVSILLFGGYVEHTISAGGVHYADSYDDGAMKFRFASAAHRVELDRGPCWSLFITGPVIREWGFHCAKGWRHWKLFVKDGKKGEIGAGCDDLS